MSTADITVRVTEETWEVLKDKKTHGDSFNDVICRLIIEGEELEAE